MPKTAQVFTRRMRVPEFALSTYDFDVLWTDVCPGPVPYPLTVPYTGLMSRHGAALTEEVYRELVNRGIATSDRQVDASLVHMLRLLGSYREAIDLVCYVGYPLQALSATDGDNTVLAVQAGGEVWLTSIRPEELVSAITDLLLEARPPVDLPQQGARRGKRRDVPALPRGEQGHLVTGRFGLSGRGRDPVFSALTWCRTDHGHYMVIEKESEAVEPVVLGDVVRRVGVLHSSFASGVYAGS